jgi:hypothetical protein
LQPEPGIRIETGDARLTLRAEPTAGYDAVLGDAFGGLAVPWHLTTIEFVTEVQRVLRSGGVYAVNLIDYAPFDFARAELATLRAAFEHVAFISQPGSHDGWAGGTFIMLAAHQPIDGAHFRTLLAERGWRHVVVDDRAAVDDFVTGAPILRDDFAPVDQLISQPDF